VGNCRLFFVFGVARRSGRLRLRVAPLDTISGAMSSALYISILSFIK
jgi:hypothetical protein